MATNKSIHVSGRRKQAIARATISEGKGMIRINSIPLTLYSSKMLRDRIAEPLIISEDVAKKIKIDVHVQGGGVASQAEAVRLAIARAIVAYTNNKELKQKYLTYDRHLLIADVRRKEPYKPNDSKARAARQKSYR